MFSSCDSRSGFQNVGKKLPSYMVYFPMKYALVMFSSALRHCLSGLYGRATNQSTIIVSWHGSDNGLSSKWSVASWISVTVLNFN